MEARKRKSSKLLAWVVVIAVAFTMTFPTAFVWGAETSATSENVVVEDQTPGEDPAVEESSNKDPTDAAKAEEETKQPAVKKAAKTQDVGADGNVDQETTGGSEESADVVASIGGEEYTKLEDAIAAAEDGDTIVLQNDVATETTFNVSGKKITLNLNGHDITNNNPVRNEGTTISVVDAADLTITDSSYAGEYDQADFEDYNGGKIISKSNIGVAVNGSQNASTWSTATASKITIDGGLIEAQEGALWAAGNGAVLTVNDGYFHATDNAVVAGNGTCSTTTNYGGTTMNIKGGVFVGDIKSSGYVACGIYHPQSGVLNVEGGTFISNGGPGIVMRNGELNMTGGTIQAKGAEDLTGQVGDRKYDLIASGVIIDYADKYNHNNAEKDTRKVSISGGTITSEKCLALNVIKEEGNKVDDIGVTGGSFSSDPSDYVNKEEYKVKENKTAGTFKVSAIKEVAKIGTTTYKDITEAASALKAGDTLTLLADVDERINIIGTAAGLKNITLDLNGNNIKVEGDSALAIGQGIQDDTTKAITSQTSADVTITGEGTIKGSVAGIIVKIGKLTVGNGVKIEGAEYGISGNGSVKYQKDDGTEINIAGGEITATAEESQAIYHPQKGILNITGGTIKGASGIQLCSGDAEVNMEGGTVIATGEDKREAKTGDGQIPDGAAVSIVNRNYPGGAPKISIKAGTFASEEEHVITAYTWSANKASEWADGTKQMVVTGGTFNHDPSAYVPDDYEVKADAGKYVVSRKADVATIGEGEDKVAYTSFEKALAAVENGQTIKLEADIKATITEDNTAAIVINKDITLDGNGKTITALNGTGKDLDGKGIGHVIGVSGGAKATIKNLTVDGNKIAKHGIQAYSKTDTQSEATVEKVTVKDCTGYGFIANGSKMTATDITTTGNGWGGVNVSKGSGVELKPLFVFNSGTLNEQFKIVADNVGGEAPTVDYVDIAETAGTWYPVTGKNQENKTVIVWTQDVTGSAEASLGDMYYAKFDEALAEAEAGSTVKLVKNITATITADNTAAIVINKNITLDGNGKTITATAGSKAGHVIEVSGGADATVKSLTVDGNNVAKHGVQVYSKDGTQSKVKVTSVTAKNFKGYGFMVNGGAMNATRIVAENNGWGGVNVGQGSGVTNEPSFIFNSGTLQENNPIQADNVGDKEPQASWVSFGINAGTWYATKTKRQEDNKVLINWTTSQPEGNAAEADGITYKTLKEAIEAATSEVNLLQDVELTEDYSAITIAAGITLNGNGKTITAKADSSAESVIDVQKNDVTITNLTIDGNKAAKAGIRIAEDKTAVALEQVTIKDCKEYGVVVDKAAVTATDLTTTGNGQGGVNVAKGADGKKFTFISGELTEEAPIQIGTAGGTEAVSEDWVVLGKDGVEKDNWHPIETKNGETVTAITLAPGKRIKSLALNTATMELTAGDKAQFVATVTPTDAYDTKVTWSVASEDNEATDVISVDGKGLVTAKNEGKAKVIATTADNKQTKACEITVNARQEAPGADPVKVMITPSVVEEVVNGETVAKVNEEDVFVAIENSTKDEQVIVQIPEKAEPVLSEEVFTKAATATTEENKATKLVVEVPAKQNTYAATFEFDTTQIENPVPVNTEIKKKEIKDDLKDSLPLPAAAKTVGLDLAHEGDFPAPANITISLDKDQFAEGDQVYIYYMVDGKLQLIDNGPLTVQAGSKVSFTLTHASEYVVSNQQIDPETAADSVDALIKAIGEVTYTDSVYKNIREAKNAYNGFTKQYAGNENLIQRASELTTAENDYNALDNTVKTFKQDVDSLEKEISGALTHAQNKKVVALKASYDGLNEDQKAAIETSGYKKKYDNIVDAYDASQKDAVVYEANKVSALVEDLPNPAGYSTAHKSKIDAARNMYNSVTSQMPAAAAILTEDLAKIQKAETEYRNAKRTAYNNARISLSTTQYTYNGDAKRPAVNGLSAFANGTDYTVTYSNNVKTGKATVTVTARGDCAGLSAKSATFRIIPAKAAISKLKKGKKSIKVTIKSQKSAGVSGYQISYSLKKNKSFKSTTTSKTSKTIKKLKAKKTYYVKVRSYKTIDGKKYYGAYSSVKKIKTK